MTTRDEWLALAERCERAEGPDRELDAALAKAAVPHTNGTPHILMWSVNPDTGRQIPNAFTRSLDAAVAVVEARFGKNWRLEHLGGECLASIAQRFDLPTGSLGEALVQWKVSYGQSPANDALALMATYCRARALEEGDGDGP